MSGVTNFYADASFTRSLGIDNFWAAFGTASERRRDYAIDTMLKLQELPAYSKLDYLYLLAAHSEAAASLNWVDYQKGLLIPSGSLTFTSDVAWGGVDPTAAGVLLTGRSVTDADIKATQNNVCAGAIVAVDGGTAGATDTIFGFGSNCWIVSRASGPRARVFSGTTAELAAAGSETGTWWVRRNSSANFDVKRGPETVTTVTNTSTSPAGAITLLGVPANSTYTLHGLSAAWGGQYLDDAEIAGLLSFISEYTGSLSANT